MWFARFLFLAPTLGVTLWSLWSRRVTWSYQWERGTTATVALLAAGLLLISPPAARIWLPAHLVGDMCLLAAAKTTCFVMIGRVLEPTYANRLLWRWVVLPAEFGILVMVTTFILSHASDTKDVLFHAPFTGLVQVYWITFALTMGHLLTLASRVLLLFCREPQNRLVASLYLASCAAGIAACVIVIIYVGVGRCLEHAMLRTLALVAIALWAGGFSVAARLSWKRRLGPYRRLMWGLTHKGKRPATKVPPRQKQDW